MVTSNELVAAVEEPVVAAAQAAGPDGSEEFLAALSRKLPPSDRDFEVFEQVAMHGVSTRAAAQEFQISQTRVRQVVERVQVWILETTPAKADEAASKQALHMAVALAGDRLDHLYGDALERWRNSDGMVERVRITRGGDMVTTRCRSHGDPKYLFAAGRMAILRSKLPTAGALMWGMAAAGDVRDAEAAAAANAAALNGAGTQSQENPVAEDHPVGDCSGNSEFRGPNVAGSRVPEPTTPCETTPSKQLSRQQQRARELFLAPAQAGAGPAPQRPSGGAALQLSLGPDVPGAKLDLLGNQPPGGTRRHSA